MYVAFLESYLKIYREVYKNHYFLCSFNIFFKFVAGFWRFSRNFSKNFQKSHGKFAAILLILYRILPKIFFQFLQKFLPICVGNLFKKFFPISSKLLPDFFENFQIFFQFFSKCNPGFSNFYIFAKFGGEAPTLRSTFEISFFWRTSCARDFFKINSFIFFRISSRILISRWCNRNQT